MTTPTRIPADVDRPDRLVGPFTARQLLILTALGVAVYLAWIATRAAVAPPVFVAVTIPVATTVAAGALTTRHGLSGDQLLYTAIRHRLRSRHLVTAPDGVGKAPGWLTAAARRPRPPAPSRLTGDSISLPHTVSRSLSGEDIGVVDLGDEGLAVVAAAGTVNLALHTGEEQDSLVTQLGHWLHSLSQPVQILVRSARLDLTGHIDGLRSRTETMSPELAAAATDHADHLAGLASDEQLLRRQVLLVWREPLDASTMPASGLGGPSATALASWALRGRRRARLTLTTAARRAAEARLLRRVGEAAELLAPLGITVTGLDPDQATAVLTSATRPGRLIPETADTAAPTDIITTAGNEDQNTIPGDLTDSEDMPAAPVVEDSAEASGAPGMLRRWRARHRRAGDAGVFAPEAMTIGARHVEVDSACVATLAITGYPREVGPAWLAPLLSHPGRLDIAMHVEPVDSVTAAARLRKQLARLESSRAHDAGRGRLTNPGVDVAVEDAADLSARVARGQGRLFRTAIYLTVHADSEIELAEQVSAVRALAASLLIDTAPVTYRAAEGWTATLPLGLDPVRVRRTFDTDALAAAFPFSSPQLAVGDPVEITRPTGVLLGRDAAGGLMFWDRFGDIDNHNQVVLGRSGAGKSYLLKAELLRSLYRGIEAIVIDPEDEYRRLADAVGGTYLHLGAEDVRLNPFDLEIHTRADGRRAAPPDALTRRKLFLHNTIAVLLGEQTPAQRAVLDTALTAAYAVAGITDDPATWSNPAPTMSVLRDQLVECGSPVGADLADGLAPFTGDGAFAGLLDGPTTTVPDGGLVVFSLRELPDELRTAGTLLALDATWRQVANPATRRPRLVVVDEAWLLMRQPTAAEFLLRAAKSFRKCWAGLTIATQDCADVLSTEIGKAIVSNAATQILLRQAPQAIDDVAAAFRLSDGERALLLSARRGLGLLSTGSHRAVFASLASRGEDDLITTDPSELAADRAGEDGGAGDRCVDLPAITAGSADTPTTVPEDVGDGESDSDDLEEVDGDGFVDLPEEA